MAGTPPGAKYGTNAYGEALPPLYIFDSKAKYPKNYRIAPRVGQGLLQVTGKYGNTNVAKFDLFLAVQRKGDMDTSLLEMILEELILPLRPNTSREVERCPLTNKMLKGPLIVKTDAGPGRLSTEADSWEFRDKMWRAGVLVMLKLPNGTAVNQELNQAYASFQPAVKRSTQRVVNINLAERVAARKRARADKAAKFPLDNVPSPLAVNLGDLDDLLDLTISNDEDNSAAEENDKEGNPDDVPVPEGNSDGVVSKQDHTLSYNQSVMNVGLNTLNLSKMVNGYPGDPIELRPFDNNFRRSNILGWWRKVGFIPMTRNVLLDPKVRYELGKGGAPEEAGKHLELLEEAYKEGAVMLQSLGYNGIDAFDIELPHVQKRNFSLSEEEKIKMLMKDKSMMHASKLAGCGLCMVNAGVVVEAHKRKIAQETKEKAKKEEEEKNAGLEVLDTADVFYYEWLRKGKPMDKNKKIKLGQVAAKSIVKALLPRVDPSKNVKDYTAMYKCINWLESLPDWEAEMKQLAKDSTKERLSTHKPLFSLDKPS